MSEPRDVPADQDTPAPDPLSPARHGNSGEGAASVLRALRHAQGALPQRPATGEGPLHDSAPSA